LTFQRANDCDGIIKV